MRYLGILGLSVAAIIAVSAVATSSALAIPQFHTEMEDTTLTGSQGQVMANILTFDLGEMKCKVAKFDGTQQQEISTTLTLKPTYEECKLAGENAKVTPNGCGYLFHLGENTETFAAKMDLECPDAKKIEVDLAECTITIPPQNGLNSAKFTNEGAEATRAIIADLNIAGFHYVEDGAGCAHPGETTTNGTYTGEITVKGENAAEEHKGIWVE
ncbi:MAG TPA: hypothetical protein VIM28_06080 [Solirubrobacterales bacterium]